MTTIVSESDGALEPSAQPVEPKVEAEVEVDGEVDGAVDGAVEATGGQKADEYEGTPSKIPSNFFAKPPLDQPAAAEIPPQSPKNAPGGLPGEKAKDAEHAANGKAEVEPKEALQTTVEPPAASGEPNGQPAERPPRKDRRFIVPDRWEDYSPVGRVIPEAHIICFKTPLRVGFFPDEDARRFDVAQLLAAVEEAGGALGLVVDLTFTRRYYDGAEFEAAGVAYRKLMIPGRDNDELARNGAVFADCLREFFAQPENKGKWVGVHCTHGLNRTGYLVCRYLHEVLGWPMDEAISKFEEARGHKMEREEYVEMLKNLKLDA